MQPADANLRWRRETAVTWTQFEHSTNWAVFHHPSGDIHLVTSAVHDIWARLGEMPDQSAAVIAATMPGEAESLEPDAALLKAMFETLDFMAEAGLVRPLPL